MAIDERSETYPFEKIFDIKTGVYTYSGLTKELIERCSNEKRSFIIAINPEKIMKSMTDPELKKILLKATHPIPDGIGLIIASKIYGGKLKNRITGIDLMNHLCKAAAENNKTVFLYGAKPSVNQKARVKLEQMHPTLKIVGNMSGYEEEKLVINEIKIQKPDILFVALGSPRQENFIEAWIDKIPVKIFQGVGGSFDVLSGDLVRAPRWMQKFGLEWFYRLIKEPSRWKRQMILPKFIWMVILDRVFKGVKKS